MSHLCIEHFASTVLVHVKPRQSLYEAARLMREHDVRHLPVILDGQLRGILSQRDIYLVETLTQASPHDIKVEEAMTRDVFSAECEEPVSKVARTMADRRIGATVVMRGSRIFGLFTTTDALRALATLAQAQHTELTMSYPEEE
jgi:acetoin utilization protein AcuB